MTELTIKVHRDENGMIWVADEETGTYGCAATVVHAVCDWGRAIHQYHISLFEKGERIAGPMAEHAAVLNAFADGDPSIWADYPGAMASRPPSPRRNRQQNQRMANEMVEACILRGERQSSARLAVNRLFLAYGYENPKPVTPRDLVSAVDMHAINGFGATSRALIERCFLSSDTDSGLVRHAT